MIVSTSAQAGSDSSEIVGFFKAGRRPRTAFRSFFMTFIFRPTFSCAASAPLSNNESVQYHEVHDALDGLCMAMVEEFDVKK